jgi:hypothetical protein
MPPPPPPPRLGRLGNIFEFVNIVPNITYLLHFRLLFKYFLHFRIFDYLSNCLYYLSYIFRILFDDCMSYSKWWSITIDTSVIANKTVDFFIRLYKNQNSLTQCLNHQYNFHYICDFITHRETTLPRYRSWISTALSTTCSFMANGTKLFQRYLCVNVSVLVQRVCLPSSSRCRSTCFTTGQRVTRTTCNANEVTWNLIDSVTICIASCCQNISNYRIILRDQLNKSHGGHVGVPDKRV